MTPIDRQPTSPPPCRSPAQSQWAADWAMAGRLDEAVDQRRDMAPDGARGQRRGHGGDVRAGAIGLCLRLTGRSPRRRGTGPRRGRPRRRPGYCRGRALLGGVADCSMLWQSRVTDAIDLLRDGTMGARNRRPSGSGRSCTPPSPWPSPQPASCAATPRWPSPGRCGGRPALRRRPGHRRGPRRRRGGVRPGRGGAGRRRGHRSRWRRTTASSGCSPRTPPSPSPGQSSTARLVERPQDQQH